jgi:AraC-like DNA-binding protein
MSKTTKTCLDGFFLNIRIAQYLTNVVWSVNGVIHPNWFFFWNPQDGAVISCGNQTFEVKPDHAYLIPPYTTISANSTRAFSHLYAHMELGEPYNRAVNKIYQLDPTPARKFFYEHLNSPIPRKILYWRIMLMEYLAMLPDEALENHAPEQDERILKVLESLNRNKYRNTIDNKTLARKANMSVNNFHRRFREMLGISPQRYIASMRLNAARNMLLNEKTSIEEIAARCNFADRYCFSKAFKQYFGVAPGAFRKNEQNKKE